MKNIYQKINTKFINLLNIKKISKDQNQNYYFIIRT